MKSKKSYDITIVGAGIVGLASAYKLKEKYPNAHIALVEKENDVAKHQSGNNSGVIHSGIYYTPGSLKAKNCINGYAQLIEFLMTHDIPYELCGKIIVATSENEITELDKIYEKGIQNGLKGLELIDHKGIKEIEPYVNGVRAIYVPQAGITDYAEVCLQLKKILLSKGVKFLFNTYVKNITAHQDHCILKSNNCTIHTAKIVNCVGLYSDRLAKLSNEELDYKIVPFRGEYYDLKPSAYHLVNGLIYPVPDPNFPFLGVHFTKTISGGVESGPNAVFAFAREGYKKRNINFKELFESITYPGFLSLASIHWQIGIMEMYRSFSKKAFVKSLKKLIPSITANDVIKGGAGVRAQAIKKDGSMVDDFLILKSNTIINICNAPSPAATSSLSIGEYISEIV